MSCEDQKAVQYQESPREMTETEKVNMRLRREGENIIEMLVSKNLQYDNAALKPIGVFSRKNALATIRVRIDDKLARLKHYFMRGGDGYPTVIDGEDTIADLIGYLLLLRVGAKMQEEEMRVAVAKMDAEMRARKQAEAEALLARPATAATVVNVQNVEMTKVRKRPAAKRTASKPRKKATRRK